MYSDRNALRNYRTSEAKAAYDRDVKDVTELMKQRAKAQAAWGKSKKPSKYVGTSGVPQL
jgi:hypothetical protein